MVGEVCHNFSTEELNKEDITKLIPARGPKKETFFGVYRLPSSRNVLSLRQLLHTEDHL